MTTEAGVPATREGPRRRGLADGARQWALGPPGIDRLTLAHCVHSAAEAFFTVSMAGSVFFSVSPDAARPRVLLFLVVTLAPFLVMAPLIGPLVDRVRGGLVGTMTVTFVGRCCLALLLAENLRSLLLFPLAFGILVIAKTYTVARNALVPSLVADEQDLVAANARLSRTATIVGGVAAAAALALYSTTSGTWTLRTGAVVYAIGAITAWRVRPVAPILEPVDADAYVELIQPDVSGAVRDMVALRASIGYALFHFSFSLRAAGDPAWVVGAVILANGTGGFVGTIVSPFLRRTMSERSMFTAALFGATSAMLAAGVAFGRVTLVGAVFVLGLAVSVSRRALDATIQRQAPHARRGQVYAGIETWLELAWVIAACLAVAVRVAPWIGVLALASFLALVSIAHIRNRVGMGLLRPVVATPLCDRLLMRAETLADHHFLDEAVVVALAALRECERQGCDTGISSEERRLLLSEIDSISPEQAARVIAQVRHHVMHRS
ncbi:MAG: MFS transporter [Ilumatobacteraceae bacterium]